MKRTTLLAALIALTISSYGQIKKKTISTWRESRYHYENDTVTKTYYKIDKDSTSYGKEHVVEHGKAFSYVDSNGNLKYKPCDSLTQLIDFEHHWHLRKDSNFCKRP